MKLSNLIALQITFYPLIPYRITAAARSSAIKPRHLSMDNNKGSVGGSPPADGPGPLRPRRGTVTWGAPRPAPSSGAVGAKAESVRTEPLPEEPGGAAAAAAARGAISRRAEPYDGHFRRQHRPAPPSQSEEAECVMRDRTAHSQPAPGG